MNRRSFRKLLGKQNIGNSWSRMKSRAPKRFKPIIRSKNSFPIWSKKHPILTQAPTGIKFCIGCSDQQSGDLTYLGNWWSNKGGRPRGYKLPDFDTTATEEELLEPVDLRKCLESVTARSSPIEIIFLLAFDFDKGLRHSAAPSLVANRVFNYPRHDDFEKTDCYHCQWKPRALGILETVPWIEKTVFG